ncbi:MAG: hypothetical protein J7M32_06375 [Deltaproteobacteria bacterium]|nr:hypothetical protein [Deltaproteobacteria bacterium]
MDDYKKGATLENEFEAQLLESVLNERGIPHMMRSYYDTAFDGLFQAQKGWGHVSAPEAYLDEIEAIVRELREKDPTGKETA